jgi:GNAT superfamily N-acetyltransferase
VIDQAPVVRVARSADREQVWALAREFATSFQPERGSFDASFDDVLASTDMLVLVAETQQLGVAAYLLANRHATFFANGPVVWVEELIVDRRARRSGLGRGLMERAEQWGRSAGVAYVALASRRARDFYLALGYEDSAVFFRKTLA